MVGQGRAGRGVGTAIGGHDRAAIHDIRRHLLAEGKVAVKRAIKGRYGSFEYDVQCDDKVRVSVSTVVASFTCRIYHTTADVTDSYSRFLFVFFSLRRANKLHWLLANVEFDYYGEWTYVASMKVCSTVPNFTLLVEGPDLVTRKL